MSNDEPSEELAEELKTIEATLRGLAPVAGRLDRDRLMYLAGQASAVVPEARQSATGVTSYPGASAKGLAAYRRFSWPLATAASLLLAITLGGMLVFSPRTGERIVYVERPSTDSSAAMVPFPPADSSHPSSSDQNNYLQLRNLVLTRGVDALPAENKVGGHERAEQTPSWPMLHQQIFKTEKDGGST